MKHTTVARQSADLTDAELEQHIVDCGRHLEKAMALGDKDAARHWLACQTAAVNSRSPRQVERMEDDYFSYDAEQARLDAQRRAAGA